MVSPILYAAECADNTSASLSLVYDDISVSILYALECSSCSLKNVISSNPKSPTLSIVGSSEFVNQGVLIGTFLA